VLHGLRPGPALFISAAVHGDELNGVEIIRRVLKTVTPGAICGTLLCVPVVNAYGFIGRSRYLPDRRDLNRSFPGSPTGSLAARLAHLFLNEVVRRCRYGIDLHTAAVHRENLPQVRSNFSKSASCRELSEAFGAKVALESPERPGSLRRAAREAGVDVLVYEAGEGLRFDERAIQAGVDGIANVMVKTGMRALPDGFEPLPVPDGRATIFANTSRWVRAPEGGVFRSIKHIGDVVAAGEVIGFVANPYEDKEVEVPSAHQGIIVGRTTLPIVNMGDALFHVAWADNAGASKAVTEPTPPDREPTEILMDEDEII
jgi:uncharacterized protein